MRLQWQVIFISINIGLLYNFISIILHLFLNVKLFLFFVEVVHSTIFNILFCDIHFVVEGDFLLFVALCLFNFNVLRVFPVSPFIWILKNVMAFLKHLVQILHRQWFLHINDVLVVNLVFSRQVHIIFLLFPLFHYFFKLF